MSGMYDYIQRNMWMTNNGFRDFVVRVRQFEETFASYCTLFEFI